MEVSLEQAYQTACTILGEQIIKERLLVQELNKVLPKEE